MTKFKAMKMRINNPDHSEAVQEWLFEQGYCWSSGGGTKHAVFPFLFTFGYGGIGWDSCEEYFKEAGCEEIDVQHLDPHKPQQEKPSVKSELEKLSSQLKYLDKAIASHDNKQNKRKLDRQRIIEKMEGMLPEGYGICLTGGVSDSFDPDEIVVGSVFECLTDLPCEDLTKGRRYVVKSFDSDGDAEIVNDSGDLTPFWSFHNFKRVK